MSKYCSRPQCRHKALVEYFGQAFEKENCGACDVCNGELNTIDDPLILCQKIISCVFRVDQRFGANHVADVLTGSKNQQIAKFNHDQVSTYNLLGDLPKKTVRNYIDQLVGQGFLAAADGQFPTLFITDQGRQVLRGELTPVLFEAPTPKQNSSRSVDDWEGVDRDLFEVLRTLRLTIASENSVPAYTIFHDPTLRDLSRQRPSTLEAMARISGVGEKKLTSFGERFVDAISSYCDQHDVAMDQPALTRIKSVAVSSAKSLSKVGVMKKAFALFAQGTSVEDVAAQLDRAPSTTSGYLANYISENNVTDPSPWVDAAQIPKIHAAAEEVGSLERLAPIKELVGDEISYQQLRTVIECLKVQTR
jgi:ATP-dependent DNA helicase RecQ